MVRVGLTLMNGSLSDQWPAACRRHIYFSLNLLACNCSRVGTGKAWCHKTWWRRRKSERSRGGASGKAPSVRTFYMWKWVCLKVAAWTFVCDRYNPVLLLLPRLAALRRLILQTQAAEADSAGWDACLTGGSEVERLDPARTGKCGESFDSSQNLTKGPHAKFSSSNTTCLSSLYFNVSSRTSKLCVPKKWYKLTTLSKKCMLLCSFSTAENKPSLNLIIFHFCRVWSFKQGAEYKWTSLNEISSTLHMIPFTDLQTTSDTNNDVKALKPSPKWRRTNSNPWKDQFCLIPFKSLQ